MIKYAANAYLATRISFINQVASLCEEVGVDVDEVIKGIGADARIGYHFLYPGVGYGGSCFPKDVQAFAHVAQRHGVEAELIESVHAVNVRQQGRLVEFIEKRFGKDLKGKTFALWGCAFKPNTDDIREAPVLRLIDGILERGGAVRAHDPKALPHIKAIYGDRVTCCARVYEALEGADALAISTEWNEFRSPDFERIRGALRAPVIFDGRNVYNLPQMRRLKFEYYSIGRPALTKDDLGAA
jgi:UDPglucose 6-dehydrogenase